MISYDYINVISIIDDDIYINETVYNNVYKYVDKIVNTYKEYQLTIYLQLTFFDNIIYIKIDNIFTIDIF